MSRLTRCGELFDARQHLSRLPVVGRIPLNDLAVFADEDGRKGVGQGLVGLGRHAYVEELMDGGEAVLGGSGKVPMGEFLFRVTAGVGPAVAAKDLRGVVL